MRHPIYLIILFSLILATCFTAVSQTPEQYVGKLDAELVPDMVHVYKRVYYPLKTPEIYRYQTPLEKDAVVRVGAFIDERASTGAATMLIVEPPQGMPYLWLDQNANGKFETDERFDFRAGAGKNGPDTIIWLPIKNSFYKKFPVYFHYLSNERNAKALEARLIEQSVSALAYGHVDVKGRSTLFMYPFGAKTGDITPTSGVLGVDVNGDGSIRNAEFSVESAYADDAEIVFPLGDIFVSTPSIDPSSGKINVRRREKQDYHRIDLEVGTEMPDFAFTDLDGKLRHLSDFRGKYLMVDFWGAWCGDCVRETPFQLAAYERFKKRGFEILGLDTDEKLETVRSYLGANKITWSQATNESIKKLANLDYRIQEYPSAILLGPDGKVLVLDQKQLEGGNLELTLERLLPR